ncbi:MAG: nitroreductase family protein [Candidatus Pacebacteria bacterium]|nr:nitroreductase family protein [Candidatus Paceibacterota bacterium]
MNLRKAIEKRRSIRAFSQKEIPEKILRFCIDQARFAPSAMNKQPLEYIIVNDRKREQIFNNIVFGGQVNNKEKKPTAYIIVLSNSNINQNPDYDVGLAVQNIVLTAFSQKMGTCILGSINQKAIRSLLNIPFNFEIKLVIALGYPAEKSITQEVESSFEYYRKNNILVVPKRKLKNIIHFNSYEE